MGCCHSTPAEEADETHGAASHPRGDSSLHPLAPSISQHGDNNVTPGGGLVSTSLNSRSSRRRQPAPGEQFNAPLRQHVWTSKRPWTRSQLERERRDFFDTRVTGHMEIWATLKTTIEILADGDVSTAQSILNAAAITVPTGDLKNGAYDDHGNLYSIPEHIISNPQNTVQDSLNKEETGDGFGATSDDDEELDKKDEKGKGILEDISDLVKIRARLSDRGGPDIIVEASRSQHVRVVVRKIQEQADLPGKGKIKIAYMGKILKDNETLRNQGWTEGHVVNALVF